MRPWFFCWIIQVRENLNRLHKIHQVIHVSCESSISEFRPITRPRVHVRQNTRPYSPLYAVLNNKAWRNMCISVIKFLDIPMCVLLCRISHKIQESKLQSNELLAGLLLIWIVVFASFQHTLPYTFTEEVSLSLTDAETIALNAHSRDLKTHASCLNTHKTALSAHPRTPNTQHTRALWL